MADRTSIVTFASLFVWLAKHPGATGCDVAVRVAELARCCDFSWEQLGCDDALIALGLARRDVNGDMVYPGDE